MLRLHPPAPSPPAGPRPGGRVLMRRGWGAGDGGGKLWGRVHFAHDCSGKWWWWRRWLGGGSRQSGLGTSVPGGHPCKNPAPLAAKAIVRYRIRKVWEPRGESWLLSRGSGHGTEILISPAGGMGPSRAESSSLASCFLLPPAVDAEPFLRLLHRGKSGSQCPGRARPAAAPLGPAGGGSVPPWCVLLNVVLFNLASLVNCSLLTAACACWFLRLPRGPEPRGRVLGVGGHGDGHPLTPPGGLEGPLGWTLPTQPPPPGTLTASATHSRVPSGSG